MKGVIYARYSSDNQREESIEGQLRECKEYAERNGIMILGTYIDRALSAKTDNRPEFQHMIKDSAKGLFDVVLVWKLDRFARNRYDSARYKNILKKNGVKVISARDNISECSEGATMQELVNLLNNRGMRSIRGGKITLNIMNHLLKNRRYMGEYSYRDVVKGEGDGIPAIGPKDLFERVQERLVKIKRLPPVTKQRTIIC